MVRMSYPRKTMKLLKRLYTIHAPYYREWPMICFIREYIRQHVPEAEVQMDSWGNLYIRKCANSSLFTLHFLPAIQHLFVILTKYRSFIVMTSVSRGAKRTNSTRA